MAKKDFIKINFEDIEIAEVFFDNQKHLDEFLCAVFDFYREKPIRIKTKIVKKYFETYKKTMTFVVNAKMSGKYGAEIRAENERLRLATLEGGLEGSLEDTLSAKKKEERRKSKEEIIKSKPTVDDFILFAKEYSLKFLKDEEAAINQAKLAFDNYVRNDWKDAHNNKVVNWKNKLTNGYLSLDKLPDRKARLKSVIPI